MRVGMGYDVHKLVEDRDLIIGGVKIPHTFGLLGHSDADVLLHAVMDAPYENVRFYGTEFNEAATITDMYQYMDYIHGSVLVTERMAQKVGSPEDEITLDTYQSELAQLREVFERFRARVETEGYGFIYEGPIG